MSTTPSIDQLKRAISISEEIVKLQEELASILGGSAVSVKAPVSAPAAVSHAAPRGRRGSRGLSAEGRARIAAAQKARWAKAKGDATPAAPSAAKAKGKRVLSPEARARIVAAVKRRWARERKTAR